MYITTFYSFKGGVGRTMALVNVAVELANRGKRVLIVDFDLEAPGLDTFKLGRHDESTLGIVDFVRDYLNTEEAPDASHYLFESSDAVANGGRLWIMPSGAHDGSYASRLSSIDWHDLYEHHDGYLLFEDLKLQWQDAIEPDYVLLDSRTGYTDVGGICTRHLPDAVVALFFPNEQNLRGLTKIVSDIRAEAEGPRNKQIDLHFVLSNVPDLDDEDAILEQIIRSFQKNLGFDRQPLFIHRYASLSLLNQVIFTKDRPRSRLARQYRDLTSEIVRYNVEDRQGALDYIARVDRGSRAPAQSPSDPQLTRIQAHHSEDGEVLFRLACMQYDSEAALNLFDKAIELGNYSRPDVFLARAELRRTEFDDRSGASSDALDALNLRGATAPEVYRAVHLLLPKHWDQVPELPALLSLSPSERVWVASRHARSSQEADAKATLLEQLLADAQLPPTVVTDARHALVLALLALGHCSQAVDTIRAEQPDLHAMPIHFAFNYSMALWGHQEELEKGTFAHVLELDRSGAEAHPNANYLQCVALAHWAVGDFAEARTTALAAKRSARAERAALSCWRYLTVPASTFADDVDQMLAMIDGDPSIKPRFMLLGKRTTS